MAQKLRLDLEHHDEAPQVVAGDRFYVGVAAEEISKETQAVFCPSHGQVDVPLDLARSLQVATAVESIRKICLASVLERLSSVDEVEQF